MVPVITVSPFAMAPENLAGISCSWELVVGTERENAIAVPDRVTVVANGIVPDSINPIEL